MIQKFRRRIAITLLPAILLALKPTEARSNPAIVAPAVCVGSAGIGCIFVGVAVIGGISYHVWQNSQNNTTYHVPVYQARPRKPKILPGQMDIYGRILITHDECRKRGGTAWENQGSKHGTVGGKSLGWCTLPKN